MLSEESATGQFPVEAVAMLSRIAAETESFPDAAIARRQMQASASGGGANLADVVAASVDATVDRVSPAAVIVPTRSGATARSIARYRLPVWIVAACAREAVAQQLLFSYGVFPVVEPTPPDDWKPFARQWLRDHDLAGRTVILAAGPSPRHPDASHRMEILEL
jgi:pyruvate kinase